MVSSIVTGKAVCLKVISPVIKVTCATHYIIKCLLKWSYFSVSFAAGALSNRFEPRLTHQDQCDHIQKLFQDAKGDASQIAGMNRVLHIDKKSKTAHVQGLVSFETLLDETLRVDLRPKVVPALRGCTIKEAIECGASQSSSFKYGIFFKSVLEVELLNSTGQVITCSRTHNKELFEALPYSCGSFGCILSAKIELVAAPHYVSVSYTRYSNLPIFMEALKSACEAPDGEDFIDGVIYSDHEMVLVKGKSVAESVVEVENYARKQIFHQEARDRLSDHLSIREYLWRWDHDYFWLSRGTFAEKQWVRGLCGSYLLRSSRLNRALERADDFYQHVIAPFRNAAQSTKLMMQTGVLSWIHCDEFLNWFNADVGVYPLYICPTKAEETSPSLCLLMMSQIQCHFTAFTQDDATEKKIVELGGMKLCSSYSLYDEASFKKLYMDRAIYDKLKSCFDPHGKFFGQFNKR